MHEIVDELITSVSYEDSITWISDVFERYSDHYPVNHMDVFYFCKIVSLLSRTASIKTGRQVEALISRTTGENNYSDTTEIE